MHLTQLRLHQFRSYEHLTVMPPEGITVFVGENGAGKTNLLEAIHLCCLGRSHRTSNDRDMVRLGARSCAVHARVARKHVNDEVGVRLFAQQGERKVIYVNGKTVSRIGELMGHLTCVMFSPEDLDLVKGSPQGRRNFLDMLLSQSKASYFYTIQQYNAVLRQRNALLKEIARGRADSRSLDIWDEQLSIAAAPIVNHRRDVVLSISSLASEHYHYIAGQKDELLSMSYEGHLMDSANPGEDLLSLLTHSREDDIRRLTTSHGPHRDDLLLHLSGQDMRAYSSQGQARTAALAMRLAQIDALTKAHQETPLLLLDDVLSELDHGRQNRLLSRLDKMQTFLTCTEIDSLQAVNPNCVLKVKDGVVYQ